MSDNSHRESARNLTLRCAIVTCSDTRTAETDTSGAYIRSTLEEHGHDVSSYEIVKDDPQQITELLKRYVANRIDVVLLNGGTGISRRDNTFDAVAGMLEKSLPGFGEIFRVLSYEDIGAASMLSRATAGVIGKTLVFSMPGSTGAVRLAMDKLIVPDLKHIVWEISGH